MADIGSTLSKYTSASELSNLLESDKAGIYFAKTYMALDGVADDYSALYALINTTINGADAEIWFKDGSALINSNISTPSNIKLKFLNGGMLKPANGVVITGTNTKIEAGLHQIFDLSLGGALSGTWDIKEVYPQWFGAIGDGTTNDTEAIQAAIDFCISTNTYFKTDSIHKINSTLTANCGAKSGLSFIFNKLVCASGISKALYLYDGYGVELVINTITGGTATDIGVEIKKLYHPSISIYGKQFMGIVFSVKGSRANADECYGVVVNKLHGSGCGQLVEHGESVNTSFGFGSYTDIYDQDSTNGSIFQNSSDIALEKYENHFVDAAHTKDSLSFINCGSVHGGTIAIGGKARYLLYSDLELSVLKLLVVNEDSGAKVTKGVKIDTPSSGTPAFICHQLKDSACDVVVELPTSVTCQIYLFQPQNCNTAITRNGSSVGLSISSLGWYASYTPYEYPGREQYISYIRNAQIWRKGNSTTNRLLQRVNTDGFFHIYGIKEDESEVSYFNVDTEDPDNAIPRFNKTLQMNGGGWDQSHLMFGDYHIWVDTSGKLRIKNGAPTGDTDGTIVGTQS